MKSNKIVWVLCAAAVAMLAATTAFAQASDKNPGHAEVGPVRSSAAYAEVLLRKTDLQAELESLTDSYTEQNPKIIDLRFEIAILTKDIDRLFAVRPSETDKLTEALGKMIVRRATLATELNRTEQTLSPEHPDVKKARKKVEFYTSAIKDILGN